MMHWTRTDDSISIRTPAKLNLFLEVLGKRDDGFHDLQTVITPIDRFDHLVISRRDESGIALKSKWDKSFAEEAESERGDLPSGSRNLVYQAAELFMTRCEIERGLEIELTKTIPSRAGLGGASGNAAGTLLALNELFETSLPGNTLCQWAAELGSDIPFFVGAGTALCEGRGERVRQLPYPGELVMVVVKPDFGLSTPEIFAQLDLKVDRRQLPAGFDHLDGFDWSGHLFNRLQSAATKTAPEIKRVCQKLIDLGCQASLMTGSGSCCFGICESQEQADEIAGEYSSGNSGFVFTCRNLQNFSVRE